MDLSSRHQRAVLAAAAGVIAVAAGTTAVVTANAHATTSTTTSTTTQAQAPGAVRQTDNASPPTPSAYRHPVRSKGPLTASQAADLAARSTRARVEKLETEAGTTGVDYKVTLVRPDGSAVAVVVVGRTGQVLDHDVPEPRHLRRPDQAE